MNTPGHGVDQELKARRRKLVVSGVGITIVVILGVIAMVVVTVLWFLGWPPVGPSTINSRTGAVSVDIPKGSTASTPRNARETAWPLVGGPYRVEDLTLAADDGTSVRIFLDIAPAVVDLAELHARDTTQWLGQDAIAIRSPVRRQQSLASRTKPPGDVIEVVTVRSQHYVVTVVADPAGEDSLQATNEVLATLTVRDDP